MLINRSKELYIYCGLNMVRLVIKGLRFKRGQGACGVAWELAEVGVEEGWKPIFALDLDQSNVQLWGLDATQIKLTQELTWIVSTPIRQKNKVIGIFNIDGVKPIELNMFEAAKTKYKGEHKFISICVNFAENLREELRQYNIV